jgi:hypothetical protein
MRKILVASATVLVAMAVLVGPAVAETTAARPGGGRWSVSPDGHVTAEGGAPWYGDASDIDLWEPIVGMASTQTGGGYWLAARDSGVFSFGDAAFHGNLISQLIARDHLPPGTLTGENILDYLLGEIVDIASTGDGYYLLGKDGGVFTFGRLPFHGSMSSQLGTDAVDLRTVAGGGYVIVGANGAEWTCQGGACPQTTPPAALPTPDPVPPAPAPTPPAPTPPAGGYRNCAAARADGVTPLYVGQSGYAPHLDGDGDGVACE